MLDLSLPYIHPTGSPNMLIRKILGAAVSAALLFSIPAPAHADTYSSGPSAQDFATSAGGWSQTAQYEGLCIQQLLCPAVYNTWNHTMGDGSGYIRTSFSSLLETLPGTSTGIWESPAFAYNGYQGQTPGSVTFDMSRKVELGALLGLSVLNDASYQVNLIDMNKGPKVTVIPATPLLPNSSWSVIPSVSVNPALLKMGHSYKIQILTSYHSVVTAVVTGEVGYDNVRLTSAAKDDGKGNTTIYNIKQLRNITKNYIVPDNAKVTGKQLRVKLSCPAAAAPRLCQIQVQGLQKGKFSKAATARKFTKLRAGKTRIVKIRIKPKYVASYKAAKKVWVKSSVRIGKVRVTVRKRIKVS